MITYAALAGPKKEFVRLERSDVSGNECVHREVTSDDKETPNIDGNLIYVLSMLAALCFMGWKEAYAPTVASNRRTPEIFSCCDQCGRSL